MDEQEVERLEHYYDYLHGHAIGGLFTLITHWEQLNTKAQDQLSVALALKGIARSTTLHLEQDGTPCYTQESQETLRNLVDAILPAIG